MKTINYLILVCLALVLTISLVAGACAPAAPGEEGEEVAKLETQVAAEKKKVDALEDVVSDLEGEIAALKKPAEVQKWEPSIWASSGILWDGLVYASELVKEMSDGRMIWEPSAPGALYPVDEALDVIALGATEATALGNSYFAGKIPVCVLALDSVNLPLTLAEHRYLYEEFEGGRANEMFFEQYENYGNVKIVQNMYHVDDALLIFSKPVMSATELEGLKLRAYGNVIDALTELGASSTWIPGPELYTAMATGVFDGMVYSNAADYVALGFHEVSTHWLRSPQISYSTGDTFAVNGDVWRNLPDDLKAIVSTALWAQNYRNISVAQMQIKEAWVTAEEAGIVPVDWPAEDYYAISNEIWEVAQEYRTDPVCDEMLDLFERYMKWLGKW